MGEPFTDSSEAPTPPPSSVRWATGVWFALVAFSVFTTVFLWLTRPQTRQLLLDRKLVTEDKVDQAVLTIMVWQTLMTVFFGALFIGFTLFLRRGKGWARMGLSLSAALYLLFLLGSGVSVYSMVSLVLLVTGLTMLWLRSTSDWLLRRA